MEQYHSIIDRTPAMRAYFKQMEHTNVANMTPRDALIVSNYRLVVRVATRYQHCGLELEDLIGAGNIGLVEAADRYDASFGTPFAHYACHWINKEICHALTEVGHSIRLPERMRLLALRLCRVQQQFFAANQREATIDELAELLHTDLDTILSVLYASQSFDSLDAPIGTADDSYTLEDTLAMSDTPVSDRIDRRTQVEQVLRYLNAKQREVLVRRFFNDEDFSEIAAHMHLTTERVRQIYRSVCPKY